MAKAVDMSEVRCAKCAIKFVGALQNGTSAYELNGKLYHEHCLPHQTKMVYCQECGYKGKAAQDKCPKCASKVKIDQKKPKSKGNCYRCKMHIFSKCLNIENMKFHPKCFTCAKCDKDLKGQEFEIAEVNGKDDIICGNC